MVLNMDLSLPINLATNVLMSINIIKKRNMWPSLLGSRWEEKTSPPLPLSSSARGFQQRQHPVYVSVLNLTIYMFSLRYCRPGFPTEGRSVNLNFSYWFPIIGRLLFFYSTYCQAQREASSDLSGLASLLACTFLYILIE
jgi:hypothetical protein